jgi:ribosomal protein S12 methylthiotransferase accessory factor
MLGNARVSVVTVDASCFWGVPTVIAVVRGRPGDGAALAVGAAACGTVEQAWSKAVAEACCVRIWLLHLRRHEPWQAPLEPSDVRDFPDHVRFHADDDNARCAAFLWSSPQWTPVASIEPVRESSAVDELSRLCRRIATEGHCVLAADVTAPDVGASRLKVVRIAVPGLVALDADHQARHLGGARILEAAAALGLRDRPLRREDVNSDPHPFP